MKSERPCNRSGERLQYSEAMARLSLNSILFILGLATVMADSNRAFAQNDAVGESVGQRTTDQVAPTEPVWLSRTQPICMHRSWWGVTNFDILPLGLWKSICPRLREYPREVDAADPDGRGSLYLSQFSQTCAVQRLIQHADRIRRRTPGYMCHAGVKSLITESSPWMNVTGMPFAKGPARIAPDSFQNHDWINLLPSHPEFANPRLGPKGAAYVYERNPDLSRPPKTSVPLWAMMSNGDIQIRTNFGFANDFLSRHSMLEQPVGPEMKVVAVLIPPVEIKGFDHKRHCYNASIEGHDIDVPDRLPPPPHEATSQSESRRPHRLSRARNSRRVGPAGG